MRRDVSIDDVCSLILPRPRRIRPLRGTVDSRQLHSPVIRRVKCARGGQWFRLRLGADGAILDAGGEAGERYGRQVIDQLRASGWKSLPGLEIEDWPDFAVRGVMLDISRDKVPTMATLRRLVDDLARLRINQVQVYTEHTFAYRGHEKVWRGCSPMTAAQVRALDAYCAARGVELVPNQNSFGHMERWLKHEPYRQLAETTGPWTSPWGTTRDYATTLCPLDPRSLRLVTGLYDQLLPNFRSRLFNVGCDETFELGQGRSVAECKRRGVGRVYLDYLLKLHKAVRRRGRRMMFWSDIIHQHPTLIRHLPRDVIPLVWGYEADHPFMKQCSELKRCGLEFYVCPGTSSWCSFSGRTTNAMENLRNAARAGRKHGATGYLITDWGDFGHRQYQPASYGPFLCGATVSWCATSNAGIEVGLEVDRHFFGQELKSKVRTADPTSLGSRWLEAGRVHEASGISIKNRTVLFTMMDTPLAEIPKIKGLTAKRIAAMRRAVSRVRAKVRTADPSNLAGRELAATIDVLDHACLRGELAFMLAQSARVGSAVRTKLERKLTKEMTRIIATHRNLWLTRNRPGGLTSSVRYFEKALRYYTS
ncbi:MAG: family 20 glycosylhydrolase [Planctomycetes bacterium]|nr:family 20 glycosylhydrolase [Planctomycetota bacterium]